MNRGFTLLETLVYLALFTLIIGGLVAASYLLFQSSDRSQTKAMMQEESNFILGKILWSLNDAQTITTPANNASGPTLIASKYDATSFTVSTTSANVFLNGNRLNNENVSLDRLWFRHIHDSTTNTDGVEITLEVRARTPNGMFVMQSASTTRYIRK